jgi:23S rRNA pseudouridine1911/1915/1917 synthase
LYEIFLYLCYNRDMKQTPEAATTAKNTLQQNTAIENDSRTNTKEPANTAVLGEPLLHLVVPAKPNAPKAMRLSINHLVRGAGVSQAMRRRLRTEGLVYVNNQTSSWHSLVVPGDTITLYLPKQEPNFTPWDYEIPIIYEDEHLLIINKPTGLLMHPTSTERFHTVANALFHYFEKTKQTQAAFHPVHRLDKDTSGLVIIAKNALVQHSFTKTHTPIRKIYEALCEGFFPADYATIHWPIARKEGSIIERTVSSVGKPAHTDITCLARHKRLSLVRFVLHTGRTHQIRVHMSQLGFPLVGDDLYGGSLNLLQNQALHAIGLQFVHPMTHTFITVTAPLPKAWEPLISQYLSPNKNSF